MHIISDAGAHDPPTLSPAGRFFRVRRWRLAAPYAGAWERAPRQARGARAQREVGIGGEGFLIYNNRAAEGSGKRRRAVNPALAVQAA